jgi:hypothetical protein
VKDILLNNPGQSMVVGHYLSSGFGEVVITVIT